MFTSPGKFLAYFVLLALAGVGAASVGGLVAYRAGVLTDDQVLSAWLAVNEWAGWISGGSGTVATLGSAIAFVRKWWPTATLAIGARINAWQDAARAAGQ